MSNISASDARILLHRYFVTRYKWPQYFQAILLSLKIWIIWVTACRHARPIRRSQLHSLQLLCTNWGDASAAPIWTFPAPLPPPTSKRWPLFLVSSETELPPGLLSPPFTFYCKCIFLSFLYLSFHVFLYIICSLYPHSIYSSLFLPCLSFSPMLRPPHCFLLKTQQAPHYCQQLKYYAQQNESCEYFPPASEYLPPACTILPTPPWIFCAGT